MSPRGYGGGPGATPGSGGTLQEHLATLTAAASVSSAGDPAALPFPPASLHGSSSSQGAAGGFAAMPPRPPRTLMDTHAEVRAAPWLLSASLVGVRVDGLDTFMRVCHH